jgi:methylaspartate ammonia-lyase
MKIKQSFVIEGVGGDFWKDRPAINAGAIEDGFTYEGKPVTPGFKAICMSSEAICIMLILEDGQIAYGDGTSVAYSALSGRDPVLFAKEYIPIVEKEILPRLVGKELLSFRKLSEEFDHLLVHGKKVHTGIRYGITQALLDGVAKAKKMSMAEVVAHEYGTKIVTKPIPLFAQCSGDWYMMVDKIILRRIPIFPHASINTVAKLDKFQGYVEWTRKRIQKLTDHNYQPILHYDLYGTVGMKFKNDLKKIIPYLKDLVKAASPYQLRLEDPFNMPDRDSQIEQMKKLRVALKEEGVHIEILADEWCNVFEDVKAFTDESAADVIQIKAPDLGGIHNVIESILYCKKKSALAYLGGSCCETEISSKACLHIALATGVDEFLIKPGLGVGTGYVIANNEMQRVLALMKFKSSAIP